MNDLFLISVGIWIG